MTYYVVTVSYGKVKGRAKQYPYWQAALYKQHTTKDNRTVCKYVKHLGRAYRSEKKAECSAEEYARLYKCPVQASVRTWSPWSTQ